jgi:hypothetical protein
MLLTKSHYTYRSHNTVPTNQQATAIGSRRGKVSGSSLRHSCSQVIRTCVHLPRLHNNDQPSSCWTTLPKAKVVWMGPMCDQTICQVSMCTVGVLCLLLLSKGTLPYSRPLLLCTRDNYQSNVTTVPGALEKQHPPPLHVVTCMLPLTPARNQPKSPEGFMKRKRG